MHRTVAAAAAALMTTSAAAAPPPPAPAPILRGPISRASMSAEHGPPALTSPEGWTVARGGGGPFCAATGPVDGAAQLSIGAVGTQLLLMLYAPSLPPGQGDYPLVLAIDRAAPLRLTAMNQDSTFGAAISPDLAKALAPAGKLQLTAEGRRFVFPVRNVGPVLDAVARCAGGTGSAIPAPRPAAAIPGAGDWKLEPPVPGAPQCTARLAGKQMDLRLSLNPGGILLLAAQNPGWKPWPAGVLTSLQLDDEPALTLAASSVGDAVMTLLPDEALVGELRRARRLTWRMPSGAFQAEIAGLGPALDALRACDRRGGR